MRLTGIFIYPIKATFAISVPEAEVHPRGLAGDRRWVVVDEQGQFLHQRIHPTLTLVRSAPNPDGGLSLDAPGMETLEVAVPTGDHRRSVTVWHDSIQAADAGSEAATWFSDYLGFACRLAFMDAMAHRAVAAKHGAEGDEVSFADSMPVLLATEASLADLNRRMDQDVPMSRFRPNVVVDGSQPWEEDHWHRLRIGDVEFEGTHRGKRCVVTTIDQETGEKRRDGEPLRTLNTFRRDSKGVYFGQNLVPRGAGTVRVGDAVAVQS